MDDFFKKRERRRKMIDRVIIVGFIAVFLLIMYGCYIIEQEEQVAEDYCRSTRVTEVGYNACMKKRGF